jgi:hypothetical protein
VSTSLVQLLCRTVKLAWFDSDAATSVVDDCKVCTGAVACAVVQPSSQKPASVSLPYTRVWSSMCLPIALVMKGKEKGHVDGLG